jgi:hypothetical protein
MTTYKVILTATSTEDRDDTKYVVETINGLLKYNGSEIVDFALESVTHEPK